MALAFLTSALGGASVPTMSQVQQHARAFIGVDFYRALTPTAVRQFTFTAATPLSSTIGVAVAVALYFATVKAMQMWVRARGKPYDLRWVSTRTRRAQCHAPRNRTRTRLTRRTLTPASLSLSAVSCLSSSSMSSFTMPSCRCRRPCSSGVCARS